MAIIVQKYGGSSVADIERIQRVADRVVQTRLQGYDMVVVVSAMGKTTDGLLKMATKIDPNPTSRELDMLLSVGERVTMALLSMAIHARGGNAISFTGSQCGIMTTASHNRARIIEVRPFRVLDELEAGRIVIVAGYQGTSYKREITTLGRGGSDTTAVALAAALGAERCEIYSDIEAVYSADPKVVLDAQRLAEVTYDEMLDLSRYGAKVLNAEAVEFARRSGIALFTRSTFHPEAEGTVIRKDLVCEERTVTGVVGRKGLSGVLLKDGSLPRVCAWLRETGLVPDFACFDADGQNLLLFSDAANVGLTGQLGKAASLTGSSVISGLGVVSVVGDVFGCDEVRTAFLETVSKMADVRGLIATPTAVTVVLPEEAVDVVTRLLHRACMTQGIDG